MGLRKTAMDLECGVGAEGCVETRHSEEVCCFSVRGYWGKVNSSLLSLLSTSAWSIKMTEVWTSPQKSFWIVN